MQHISAAPTPRHSTGQDKADAGEEASATNEDRCHTSFYLQSSFAPIILPVVVVVTANSARHFFRASAHLSPFSYLFFCVRLCRCGCLFSFLSPSPGHTRIASNLDASIAQRAQTGAHSHHVLGKKYISLKVVVPERIISAMANSVPSPTNCSLTCACSAGQMCCSSQGIRGLSSA